MSDAFRCDGCDGFFGGVPAVQVTVTPQHGISDPLPLGHKPGVTDAHPGEKPIHEVPWPFHRSTVEFCADCGAGHIVSAVHEAAQGGRYADG